LAFEAQEETPEGAVDEEIVSVKESFRISSQLNEGLEEQITALTAERDRLKRFWDTYAREVDKLAFEAQEETLRGGEEGR